LSAFGSALLALSAVNGYKWGFRFDEGPAEKA
jgi:hypothetical protein